MQHCSINGPHAERGIRGRGSWIQYVGIATPEIKPCSAPLVRDRVQRLALLHAVGAPADCDPAAQGERQAGGRGDREDRDTGGASEGQSQRWVSACATRGVGMWKHVMLCHLRENGRVSEQAGQSYCLVCQPISLLHLFYMHVFIRLAYALQYALCLPYTSQTIVLPVYRMQ